MDEFEKNQNFKDELTTLINKYSMENGSDTPDYMLADYMMMSLMNFHYVTKRRTNWYKE